MNELTIELQKLLGVVADGVIGNKTLYSICEKLSISYSSLRTETVKNIQKKVGVDADGIIGKMTISAIINSIKGEKASGIETNDNIDNLINYYINKKVEFTEMNYEQKPVKQSTLRKNKSIFGEAGDESNLVIAKVPDEYPLKYEGKKVKSIRIHKFAAKRLETALKDIIRHYGSDIEKVAPGACVYDGSYNFRNTRNSSSMSIHSWGLAIDFDADRNGLKVSAPTARLSQPIYKPFWDILEYHGFLSLGRHSDKDWMHTQMTLWG